MAKKYKGRQIFMESLMAEGVPYIFGNPGTTENPLLDSLLDYPKIEYIMALHEGVAVGMANYYAQASGITGVANLHVGPGLGNGLGMLYNAYEGHTPLVLTAGGQDTRMRLRDPLLGHDLVAMAEPLTKWSVQPNSADELPLIMHRAFKIAKEPPSGPVFVSLPINVMEQETDNEPMPPTRMFTSPPPDPEGVKAAAELLAHSKNPVIFCGDGVAHANAVDELVALAEAVGAPCYYEGLHHHVCFPTHHPSCRDRLPADYSSIRKGMEGADTVLLVGGNFFEELWFDEGLPFSESTAVIHIEVAPQMLSRNFSANLGLLGDPKATLAALRDAVDATADDSFRTAVQQRNGGLAEWKSNDLASQEKRSKELWDNEPIAPSRLMAEIKAAMPKNAIIVNESITATTDLKRTIPFAERGSYYGTRGGGIGQALPGGIGAKLAHPDRPVIALSGDGSSMYSIQSLWTAVHHQVPLVYIILHNRTYRVLKLNMNIYRKRWGLAGERPYPHMDLTKPEFGFVDIARGYGMEAKQIAHPGELGDALKTALDSGKPYLLDVLTDGAV
ncbi:MAG: thiamine pyrophosphate-binding protein [SAR324 cluster bacterium]|nr:thiamine pyrophosphate-binding protein [SAR324 cluster bacterium]